MDDIDALVVAWKSLTPWALAGLLIALALWKGLPVFQAWVQRDTKVIEQQTIKIEHKAVQDETKDETIQRAIDLFEVYLRLMQSQEDRNQERFEQAKNMMLEVRDKRESMIGVLQQDIKSIPLRVVTEQKPVYDAQTAAIQNVERSLGELKTELIARISLMEQRVPQTVKKLLHDNMTAVVSKLDAVLITVKREGTDGKPVEQGRMESAVDGDSAGSVDPASAAVREPEGANGTAESGGDDQAARSGDPLGSGQPAGPDQSDALGSGETTPN